MKVKSWNYGKYKSKSYGDSRAVQIGDLTLYFSFDNLIAFSHLGHLVVCQNVWTSTTGRHLASIPHEQKDEVNPVEFDEKVETVLKRYGFA